MYFIGCKSKKKKTNTNFFPKKFHIFCKNYHFLTKEY